MQLVTTTSATPARGFTLVELLVGMTILLAGITVGVLPALVFVSRNVGVANQQTTAYELANNTIARLEALPWASVASRGTIAYDANGDPRPPPATNGSACAANTVASDLTNDLIHDITVNGQRYWVSWLVDNYTAGGAASATRRLRVLVWWNSGATCRYRVYETRMYCNRGDSRRFVNFGQQLDCD